MLCPDLVDEFLLTLRLVGQHPAITLPHVFASCAQPHSFVFEVIFLLLVEVPPVQVMLSPIIVISFLGAGEISEPQTGLRPPEVLFRSVYLLQHDGLLEQREQFSSFAVMLPEVPELFGACVKRGFGVAHAPIINGLKLPKVAHENDRYVAESAIARVKSTLAEVCPSALLCADVHACEKCRADEGDLVDDQEQHVLPGILQFPQCVSIQLGFPCSIREDLE